MVKVLSPLQIVGLVWFCASIILALSTTVYFRFWLRRRDVKVMLGLAAVPGYLEMLYMKWCREHSQSGTVVLSLRFVLLVNVLLSALIVVPFVIMKN
ncbi:MAG: hypothetical protein B7X04_01450 [Parcubacteria group bacterium 21-54-25]|nr:MAG: hypothetical protein B7X04_01450 [Parcubacteria group bacterium 21-54-25]